MFTNQKVRTVLIQLFSFRDHKHPHKIKKRPFSVKIKTIEYILRRMHSSLYSHFLTLRSSVNFETFFDKLRC